MARKVEEKIADKLSAVKVKDVMTRSVITVKEQDTLSDVADLLIKVKISGIPVVDKDKKMVGIITTTDLLNLMRDIKKGGFPSSNTEGHVNPKVKDVMKKHVYTATETQTLLDIVNMMCEKKVHTIPVVKDGMLIGVIGRRDMMMYFYAAVRDCVDEIQG